MLSRDGRAWKVDGRAQALVGPGLATPLSGDENSSVHQRDESCDLKLQIHEALGAISKLPSDEMLQRIKNVKVQYSAISGDPSMAHSGRKPKSWVLNYPTLAYMLNGGYYADYASVLGTMGYLLCTIKHGRVL